VGLFGLTVTLVGITILLAGIILGTVVATTVAMEMGATLVLMEAEITPRRTAMTMLLEDK